jgi:hypothetical protein
MYSILCCNKYYFVGRTSNRAEALRVAQSHIDGDYDNVIYYNSRIVGDSSGFNDIPDERYIDAATRTGMYDYY